MKLTQEQSHPVLHERGIWIPADYFDRLDTPAKDSPVGKLMRKIRSAFPHLDLETIRLESRASLYGVGSENRVSIAFNRFQRSRKVDNAPRRAQESAHGLETAAISPFMSGTSSANEGAFENNAANLLSLLES
jgi:hypothetical protein